MTDRPLNVNAALVVAMRAEAAALEAQAAAKRAQAEALEQSARASDRDLLDVEQSQAQYNFGRDALLNAQRRGELELVRGARNRIMVERAALETYIKSRPVARPRKVAPADDLGSWEAQAEKALRSVGGAGK